MATLACLLCAVEVVAPEQAAGAAAGIALIAIHIIQVRKKAALAPAEMLTAAGAATENEQSRRGEN